MLLRHNTLPPFIHPQFTGQNVENDQMESLENCISLVRMIGNGSRSSRKLFWKNVRMECERLYRDVSLLMGSWGFVAIV